MKLKVWIRVVEKEDFRTSFFCGAFSNEVNGSRGSWVAGMWQESPVQPALLADSM